MNLVTLASPITSQKIRRIIFSTKYLRQPKMKRGGKGNHEIILLLTSHPFKSQGGERRKDDRDLFALQVCQAYSTIHFPRNWQKGSIPQCAALSPPIYGARLKCMHRGFPIQHPQLPISQYLIHPLHPVRGIGLACARVETGSNLPRLRAPVATRSTGVLQPHLCPDRKAQARSRAWMIELAALSFMLGHHFLSRLMDFFTVGFDHTAEDLTCFLG